MSERASLLNASAFINDHIHYQYAAIIVQTLVQAKFNYLNVFQDSSPVLPDFWMSYMSEIDFCASSVRLYIYLLCSESVMSCSVVFFILIHGQF